MGSGWWWELGALSNSQNEEAPRQNEHCCAWGDCPTQAEWNSPTTSTAPPWSPYLRSTTCMPFLIFFFCKGCLGCALHTGLRAGFFWRHTGSQLSLAEGEFSLSQPHGKRRSFVPTRGSVNPVTPRCARRLIRGLLSSRPSSHVVSSPLRLPCRTTCKTTPVPRSTLSSRMRNILVNAWCAGV